MYKGECTLLLFVIISFLFIRCDTGISYDYYLRSDLFGQWYRCKRTSYHSNDTTHHYDDKENIILILVIDQQFFREYKKSGGCTYEVKYNYYLRKNILHRENSSIRLSFEAISFRDDTLCILEYIYGSTNTFFLPYEGSIPPKEWPDSIEVVE